MEVCLQALRSLSSGLLGLPRTSFPCTKPKYLSSQLKDLMTSLKEQRTVAKMTSFLMHFNVFLTNLYKTVLER